MPKEEIREFIYLGVSLLLLAGLLQFISFCFGLRDDFASVKNGQYMNELIIKQDRMFSKYDCKDIQCTNGDCGFILRGDELIELIRNNKDTNLVIYIQGKESISQNYNGVENIKLVTLQKEIQPNDEFHTYLVYNGLNTKEVTRYQQNTNNFTVTGIKVIPK